MDRRPRYPYRTARTQLQEYFDGRRDSFQIKIQTNGTDFEYKVWEELKNIPFGMTTSYGEQKKLVLKNAQAVGSAMENPIAVVILARVRANNDLIGYSGGLDRKKWLLKYEGALLL